MKRWYQNVCFILITFLFLFPFSVINAQNNDAPELGPFYPGSTPGMKTVVPEQPVDINKVFEDAGIQGGGIIMPDGKIFRTDSGPEVISNGTITSGTSDGEGTAGNSFNVSTDKNNLTGTNQTPSGTNQSAPTRQPTPTQPQTNNTNSRATYTPLVPGFPQPDTSGTKDFAGYVNSIIKIIIGLTGILAVLMIVVGGIQYVSTDSWNDKDSGKKRIQAALGGLLLALSSFLILNTIDPSLTYLNFADSLKPITVDQVVGGFAGQVGGMGVEGASGVNYDTNESGSLDPSGAAGQLHSGALETNSEIDSCVGLDSYRAAGNFTANDKGGNAGGVVGEVAWLIQAVPLKWSGLQVMSSYRSLKWNLTSAYGVDPARANQIIADFESTDKSYSARVAIANKYGLKRAALTSNHVLGQAVDFSGSKPESDALAAWARSNSCIKFGEVLWQVEGHYDHVHLGV